MITFLVKGRFFTVNPLDVIEFFIVLIVLYEPEIPQNTGNIIRLCANSGASLGLVEPLGFDLSHKQLRRAGLDYHEYVSVDRYCDWSSFLDRKIDGRLFGFSSKAEISYDQCLYTDDDIFLFGPETRGLPQSILAQCEATFRIPMSPNSRSLNLANSVSIVLYEALRQQGFSGLC